MTGQLELAYTAMDEALAAVDQSADEWSRNVVDAVLREGVPEPFTTDDCRDLIPAGISPHLLSARINSARMSRRLKKVGERPSLKLELHGKALSVWVRAGDWA